MGIEGKTALIITANLVEDIELLYPRERLKEEGVKVTVVSLDGNPVKCKKGHGPAPVDAALADVDGASFDALIIPGGFAPDWLRMSEDVLDLVRKFDADGKPVAFICHGTWVPISAGVLKGRKTTGYIAVRDDVINAGAEYINEPTVIDGSLIAARDPGDLGPWMKAIIAAMQD